MASSSLSSSSSSETKWNNFMLAVYLPTTPPLPVSAQSPSTRNLDQRGWHNLLREGVEPNPGPTFTEIQTKLLVAFPDHQAQVREVFQQLLLDQKNLADGTASDANDLRKSLTDPETTELRDKISNDRIKKKILARIFEEFPNTDFPDFNPSDYKLCFHSLDPNDFDTPLLNRQIQVKEVQISVQRNENNASDKPMVFVLSSTRGMGKTFFLKKIVEEVPSFSEAASIGRVFSFNLSQVDVPTSDDLLAYLPNLIVLYNISRNFDQRKVCGKNFEALDNHWLADCLRSSDRTQYATNPFHSWAYDFLRLQTGALCQETMEITNSAFSVMSKVRFVFLLDNAHTFVELSAFNTKAGNHTKLSYLLSRITDLCLMHCLVAGTSDGNLELYTDYSNFIPKPLSLKPLEVKDCEELGKKLTAKWNLEKGVQLEFPAINNTNYKTEENKEALLMLAMIYDSCQVPRLVKIAIRSWLEGKSEGKDFLYISTIFYYTARDYYRDVLQRLSSMTTEDLAMMLISCSVHFEMKVTDTIPNTKLKVGDLINHALVFPFLDGCYVVPTVLWAGPRQLLSLACELKPSTRDWHLEENSALNFRKITELENTIQRLVPGLSLPFLGFTIPDFWEMCLSLSKIGSLWERLVTASLATVYFLHHSENPKKRLQLCDIYKLKTSSSSAKWIHRFIDFSQGMVFPSRPLECTTFPKGIKGVVLNAPGAQHDAILPTASSPIAVQCKNSLDGPAAGVVTKQLLGCKRLLWFYPGCAEDNPNPPIEYRHPEVSAAIADGRLCFLSGAGCVSPLMIDLLLILKRFLK